MEKIEFLSKALDGICKYDDKKLMQMIKFYDMIIEKNKVMNLTAITDYEEFVIKHFVDSLSISRIYDIENFNLELIDVGTGAGFPGIPIKIMYPNIKITLFDSLKKRLDFLDEVITALNLENIKTVHGRAEEFGRKEDFREKYDLAVSRAVAELPTLCEITIPFVKVNGSFIAYKGSKGEEELEKSLKGIQALGCKIVKKESFDLNGSQRILIEIKKEKSTDRKYPRGGGKPFKTPLYID